MGSDFNLTQGYPFSSQLSFLNSEGQPFDSGDSPLRVVIRRKISSVVLTSVELVPLGAGVFLFTLLPEEVLALPATELRYRVENEASILLEGFLRVSP